MKYLKVFLFLILISPSTWATRARVKALGGHLPHFAIDTSAVVYQNFKFKNKPIYFEDNKTIQQGFLAEDAVYEGIKIHSDRELWFHENGKLQLIKGTGYNQVVKGKEIKENENIEFDEQGVLLFK